MNKKIFFLAGLILLLTGCSRATFYPDVLPDACLNQPYEAKIMIGGGMVISDSDEVYGTISNKNFQLIPKIFFDEAPTFHGKLEPVLRYNGNELTISGTPTSLEPIDVKINVDFYKHMFSFFEPSNGHKKTYTIYVRQCG